VNAGFVTPTTLIRDEERENVICYGVGICHASVCAPEAMPVDDLLDAVNRLWPTGLDHGWMVATNESFASGEPNPCPCEQTLGRVHRLLEC
jgi:hypothetical protein